ncbi:MAG: filamentous hemagglutinin N-terminal domain-containing protein [Pseudomonadota bacterium]
MRAWLSGCAALALVCIPAFAQDAGAPPTTITPDTLPQLSTGTTATTEGAVTTIGGGVRAGDNLFHSFTRFNLGPGDIARWTASDALTIRNVINRVTGGETSFIAGTIDTSAMPGADFFFLNPAGIMFGDGAAIDVGGTAHFSTAQQLGFADGTMLVSGTASGSSFSMAEPARFGFLGGNAPITLRASAGPGDAAARGVGAGRIALSASDIVMESSSLFAAQASLRAVGQNRGALDIAAAPDQGLRGGRISLNDSRILLQDDGRIDLVAGTITLDTFSEIGVTASAGALPAINLRADLVDLVSGELRVSGIEGLAERSGDIRIRAGQIVVRQAGAIRTESRLAGGGGTIFLEGDRIEIDEGIVTATGLSAPGRSVGDIQVRGGLLRLTNTGLLSTTLFQARGAFMPTGTTGNILIDVDRLEMASQGLILASSSSSTASGPGSITIRANSMAVGIGLISTSTDSATAAGPIHITVTGLLELSGIGGIQSISQGLGDAGAIAIRAGTLRLINNGFGGPSISSETELPRAQEFTRLADYTGNAGRILIQTDSLEMDGITSITTSSSSLGNAGDIVISAGRIALSGEAEISSAARKLLVPPSNEDFEADPDLIPSLRELPGPGRAGRVLIATTGTLTMNGGTISTATEGLGAAGEVTVVADRIMMGRGSRVSSDAGDLAPGQAGTVALIARQIMLSDGAEVTTSSANATTAGGIALAAEEELLVTGQGSRIASTNTASSGGAAGNIIVGAPRITLGPGGTITTSALTGAAGQIELALPETGLLRLAGGAMPAAIATSSGPGTGGRITISRPYALIADGARIEALGQQRGANVQLATDFFIRSADNSNLLLVDGDLVVDSQVGNVSSGIDTPDISFGDAAGVLAGQCRAARSSGSVSRLAIDQVGPLALDALDVAPSGACR